MEVKAMKKLMCPKGKITFSTILIMLILFYGGFVAYKFISSRLTKAQIKNEIIEKYGFIRGPDFTEEKGEDVIIDILISHDLFDDPEEEDPDKIGRESSPGTEIFVEIKNGHSETHFIVTYNDQVDLLFFKVKVRYVIDEEIRNYN